MKIQTYTLSIPDEIEITFLNYGGIIQKLKVPDRKGKMEDVVLGFDNPEDYLKDHPYFGALIGRYANRIKNGSFTIGKNTYSLPKNEGANTLHGGVKGFDKVFWDVQKNLDGQSCTLRYESPDMEEGFPGKLRAEVTYTINRGREFVIDYKVSSNKATPVNLTSHAYFNLGGPSSSSILDHELWINSDCITEVNEELIPTGEIVPVKYPFDFRQHKRIGLDLEKVPGGYDHNFVLNDVPIYDPKARLMDPVSGRMMEILTTEPGLQFYSGNFLSGALTGKNGMKYQKHSGLCLETQHFPDSPNQPHFPSTLVGPLAPYFSKTIYKFTAGV